MFLKITFTTIVGNLDLGSDSQRPIQPVDTYLLNMEIGI
jgi:hypothetical protein